jgi:hypothetical protein
LESDASNASEEILRELDAPDTAAAGAAPVGCRVANGLLSARARQRIQLAEAGVMPKKERETFCPP